MINPWVIVAGLVALVSAFGGGYWWGADAKENELRAEYATKLETTIKQHNEDAASDMQSAAEWAERRGIAQGRADAGKSRLGADIVANPLPANCALAAPSVSVLNELVRAANDLAPSTDRVPGTVSSPSGIGLRRGTGEATLGSGTAGPSGKLPAPAR